MEAMFSSIMHFPICVLRKFLTVAVKPIVP